MSSVSYFYVNELFLERERLAEDDSVEPRVQCKCQQNFGLSGANRVHSGRIRFTGRLSGDKKIWLSRFPSLVCYAKIARKRYLTYKMNTTIFQPSVIVFLKQTLEEGLLVRVFLSFVRVTLIPISPLKSSSLRIYLEGELPKSRNSVRITCFSFGEPSRLDYGTGHELSFCAFLLCCLKLNVYTSRDMYHLGVSVFPKYNSVIRKVILTYR